MDKMLPQWLGSSLECAHMAYALDTQCFGVDMFSRDASVREIIVQVIDWPGEHHTIIDKTNDQHLTPITAARSSSPTERKPRPFLPLG